MNKTLAEFLVADGRPKNTKNYPELNGFLYAVACAPEMIDAKTWLPEIFGSQSANYKNEKEKKEIEQGLFAELSQIEERIENHEPVLAAYFRPSDELMENFEEDSPIAHWGIGFMAAHQWLEPLWNAYFPEEEKSELSACVDLLSFFSSKDKAQALCNAQNIEDLALDVYAESVLANFNMAAEGYAHYGFAIRAALKEHNAHNN